MLQAAAAADLVTRQADAGAPAPDDVVPAGGTLDKRRARRRALAALAALREGQEWILVALGARPLDGEVGLSRGRLGRCLVAVVVVVVVEGEVLLLARGSGRRARRAVLRVPEAGGRGSWGAGTRRVQAAQAKAEDAVRERPAGGRCFSRDRSRRRRRRLGGVGSNCDCEWMCVCEVGAENRARCMSGSGPDRRQGRPDSTGLASGRARDSSAAGRCAETRCDAMRCGMLARDTRRRW